MHPLVALTLLSNIPSVAWTLNLVEAEITDEGIVD